jgi:hypothetical protein
MVSPFLDQGSGKTQKRLQFGKNLITIGVFNPKIYWGTTRADTMTTVLKLAAVMGSAG